MTSSSAFALPADCPLANHRLIDQYLEKLDRRSSPFAHLKKTLSKLWDEARQLPRHNQRYPNPQFTHLYHLLEKYAPSPAEAEAFVAGLPGAETLRTSIHSGWTTLTEEERQARKIHDWWGCWLWERYPPAKGSHVSLKLLNKLVILNNSHKIPKEEAWELLDAEVLSRTQNRGKGTKERREKRTGLTTADVERARLVYKERNKVDSETSSEASPTPTQQQGKGAATRSQQRTLSGSSLSSLASSHRSSVERGRQLDKEGELADNPEDSPLTDNSRLSLDREHSELTHSRLSVDRDHTSLTQNPANPDLSSERTRSENRDDAELSKDDSISPEQDLSLCDLHNGDLPIDSDIDDFHLNFSSPSRPFSTGHPPIKPSRPRKSLVDYSTDYDINGFHSKSSRSRLRYRSPVLPSTKQLPPRKSLVDYPTDSEIDDFNESSSPSPPRRYSPVLPLTGRVEQFSPRDPLVEYLSPPVLLPKQFPPHQSLVNYSCPPASVYSPIHQLLNMAVSGNTPTTQFAVFEREVQSAEADLNREEKEFEALKHQLWSLQLAQKANESLQASKATETRSQNADAWRKQAAADRVRISEFVRSMLMPTPEGEPSRVPMPSECGTDPRLVHFDNLMSLSQRMEEQAVTYAETCKTAVPSAKYAAERDKFYANQSAFRDPDAAAPHQPVTQSDIAAIEAQLQEKEGRIREMEKELRTLERGLNQMRQRKVRDILRQQAEMEEIGHD
jgi:hypothetical protein